MSTIRHIFFDLDRTLWDFEYNSKLTLNQLHDSFKLSEQVAFDAFYHRYRKINAKLWKAYRRGKIDQKTLRSKRFTDTLLSFNIDPDLGQKIGEEYVLKGPKQTKLFPGTDKILSYLATKYKLHILTNGFAEVQHIKLSNSTIDHYFHEVVCSEKVGVQKPDRKVFDYALDLAGSSAEETLMIGDDFEADVRGALKSGWQAVWFNPQKYHRHHKAYEVEALAELSDLL